MTYLMNAAQYLYTHHETQMQTVYSSKIERMMRTVNQRMNTGVWSEAGALAVAKIRLAFYYNGFGSKSGLILYVNKMLYTENPRNFKNKLIKYIFRLNIKQCYQKAA